jgi:hypothetical protein
LLYGLEFWVLNQKERDTVKIKTQNSQRENTKKALAEDRR